jgi:hypothetical protein
VLKSSVLMINFVGLGMVNIVASSTC